MMPIARCKENFPEVATWAAYLVHFSNQIFEIVSIVSMR